MDEPFEYLARPVYAAKAKLVDGNTLYTTASVTHDAIGEYAKCHPNTVRAALQGKSKQYVKAHDIFTAINCITYNSFARSRHVYYLDEKSEGFMQDDELDNCRVLPIFCSIFSRRRLSITAMSKDTHLPPNLISEVQRGRPVDARVVGVIADFCIRLGEKIDKDKDIIR